MLWGFVLVLLVVLTSYFENREKRRFWLARLTYDEPLLQQAVRSCFIFGWVIELVCSVIFILSVAADNFTFWNLLFDVAFMLAIIWVLAHVAVILCIGIKIIWRTFVVIWKWITGKEFDWEYLISGCE